MRKNGKLAEERKSEPQKKKPGPQKKRPEPQTRKKEHRPKKKTPETEVTEGKHRGKSFAYAAADVHYAKWLVSQKGRLKKTNLIELVEYIEAHL